MIIDDCERVGSNLSTFSRGEGCTFSQEWIDSTLPFVTPSMHDAGASRRSLEDWRCVNKNFLVGNRESLRRLFAKPPSGLLHEQRTNTSTGVASDSEMLTHALTDPFSVLEDRRKNAAFVTGISSRSEASGHTLSSSSPSRSRSEFDSRSSAPVSALSPNWSRSARRARSNLTRIVPGGVSNISASAAASRSCQ